ncbi:MAG: energy transducer TonB [Casimicrobium sp.]
MFHRTRASVLAALSVAFVSASSTVAVANTETVFPKANRILRAVVPPQCKDWVAPKPDRRTNVIFPQDAQGIKGDAALLLRIGANGEYQGVADFLASDEAYAKAAEEAVKEWTFSPALCNGQPMASEARVDFEFRREGGITYGSGSAFGRK